MVYKGTIDSKMLDMALRVLDNEATPAEARSVATWFSTPEGQLALSELMDQEMVDPSAVEQGAVSEQSLNSVYLNIMRHIKLSGALRRGQQEQRRSKSWFAVAASTIIPLFLVFGIIAVGVMAWSRMSSMGETIVVADYGQKVHVTLGDGSTVHLNSNSKLCYSPTFGLFARKVQLDGQAYFSVEADENNPFVVDVDGAEVCVTGTKFDVNAYEGSDKVVVSLDEGVVTFESKGNDVTLTPLQQLTFSRSNSDTNITSVEYGKASEWRYDRITLDKAPMRVLLERMSHQYGYTFKVIDTNVYKYTYILRSENQSYEELVRSIERITPVRFSTNGSTVEVSMK